MDIEANPARLIGDRSADARYDAFDYCFRSMAIRRKYSQPDAT
jgi:hypothetical protein